MKHDSFDFLIVGGGLSAYSVCYWLQRHNKDLKLAVVQSPRASHRAASLLNAGFLTVGSLDFFRQNQIRFGARVANEILDLCKRNHMALVAEDILATCPSYVKAGSVSVTSTEFGELPSGFSPGPELKVRLLNGEQAWHYQWDGSVDPKELLSSLKAKCRAKLFEAHVLNIKDQCVHTDTEVIKAGQIIVATNAWAGQLSPACKVRPTRAQALVTNSMPDLQPMNYYFSDHKAYVRVCKDHRLIVGGMRGLDPEREETDRIGLNPTIQAALLKLVQDRFCSKLRAESQWSGIMGFTQSQLPVVGEKDGVLYQYGFSGHGMGMCFLMAKYLVQWKLSQLPLPAWIQDPNSN